MWSVHLHNKISPWFNWSHEFFNGIQWELMLLMENVLFFYRLFNITWFGAVNEKYKLFQTSNLIFTTKFNFSSILFTIIPWDYLNLSLANEYVWPRLNTNQGYQVEPMLLQAAQPIRLQYSHQIKLLSYIPILQNNCITSWQINSLF